jgi:MFS family permease
VITAVPPAKVPVRADVVALWCLGGMGLLAVSQFYLVIPLFPQLRQEWQLSLGEVVLSQSLFGVGYAIGFLIWGAVADRHGYRRVMVRGVLGAALVTASLALVDSFFLLLVGRVVQGLVLASFAPAAFAYIGARLAPSSRTVAITVLTSSFFAASVVGQVIGQLAPAAWRWQFAVAGVVLLVMSGLLSRGLVADPVQESGPTGSAIRAFASLLTRMEVVMLLMASLTVMSGFDGIYLAVQSSGTVPAGTPLLLLRASALPAMVLVPLLARRLRVVPALSRLCSGFVASAVLCLAAVIAGDRGPVVLGAFLFAYVTITGLVAPALVEAIIGFGQHARGASTALYTFMLFCGASLGPVVLLIGGRALDGAVLVTGLLAVAGALLTAVVLRIGRSTSA